MSDYFSGSVSIECTTNGVPGTPVMLADASTADRYIYINATTAGAVGFASGACYWKPGAAGAFAIPAGQQLYAAYPDGLSVGQEIFITYLVTKVPASISLGFCN